MQRKGGGTSDLHRCSLVPQRAARRRENIPVQGLHGAGGDEADIKAIIEVENGV